MKANFYSPQYYNNWSVKCFVIFFFLLILIAGKSMAQVPVLYQGDAINAEIKDTAEYSPCRFPYSISNKSPQTGETAKWKAIKGTINLSADNMANIQLKDAKGDTILLTYTISNPNRITYLDTLVLLKNKNLSCTVIDRGMPNLTVECGATITLYSKLPLGYSHMWTTSSPNITIVNSPNSRDIQIKVLAAGGGYVTVNAVSPNGYNTFFDTYQFATICPSSNVTQADAGFDRRLMLCQFPYTLSGNAPATGETVKWEVLTGSAFLQNETSKDVKILDVSSGTQLKYTITRGDIYTSDVVAIYTDPNLTDNCITAISNNNPKCGDTITVNFDWLINNQYALRWTSSPDLLQVSSTTTGARFKVLQGGTHEISVLFNSNYNTFNKKIIINATCPANSVTKANAGSDLFLAPCKFPQEIFGNITKTGELVKWEAIPGTGIAHLLHENSPNAVLMDATNGVKIKYTIYNDIESSTDTLTVFMNDLPGALCDPVISNHAPACGDTVRISFNFQSSPAYTFDWTFAGITPLSVNGSMALLVMKQTGNYQIRVKIKSPYQLNEFEKVITLSSTCPEITRANAGPDATIYCDTYQLSGSTPGPNETGTWTIIEGQATILENHYSKSNLVNINSSRLVLVWTHNKGTLTSSDTVVLNVNKLKVMFPNYKDATCNNTDGRVQAIASGGLPPYRYFWANGSAQNELTNIGSGKYRVTVFDQSGCQVRDSITIKDNCNEVKLYTLEGNVYGRGNLFPNGLAILIKDIGGLPIPVKTVHVENGFYKFTGIEKGDYIVYVLPYKDQALTTLDDFYLPTYYVNKVNIAFANPVHVVGNTFSVDIKLAERKSINAGMAKLNTNIGLGSETAVSVYPALLFNENNELVSSGFYNNGSVDFGPVAPGNYYVSMALEGKGYRETEVFNVTSGQPVIDTELKEGTVTGYKAAKHVYINAFPNPFRNEVTIDLPQEYTANLIEAISGKSVKSFTMNAGQNKLNLEHLSSGMYILQLSNDDEFKNISLIKQ